MEYLRKRCGVSFPYARQESLPEARDRSLSPSGTSRGLEWETQPAQSAIIGLPVSYVHTAVTLPYVAVQLHLGTKNIYIARSSYGTMSDRPRFGGLLECKGFDPWRHAQQGNTGFGQQEKPT